MKVFGYTALEGYFARPTGVGKHIDQMFHGLSLSPGVDFQTLTASDQVASLQRSGAPHPLADLPRALIPYGRRRLEWSWLLTGRPRVDAWAPAADWIYCPYEVNLRARRSRVAVTIHSLFQFDPDRPGFNDPSARKLRLRYGYSFSKAMREADLLLTVSQFVKSQMMRWYCVPEERIIVVGNGVEEEFYQAGANPAAPATGNPYVVCLSGLNELDGAPYVLSVARELLDKDRDIEIRVAGHQHEPQFLEQAKSLPNIRLLGYVDKRDLAGLMRHSVALLFLNRYESFGIAAVEGMAARTPVIGTNFTAVPEVMGDAGMLADVSKPAEIAELIVGFARSESLREPYIARGSQRAELFRWSACVDRLRTALTSA